MTHQEYVAAITKQRSIISRLFKCRENRSKMIEAITKKRYADIIGKFFKADDRLDHAHRGEYYYIVDVYTCSNYIGSNKVDVKLHCRCFNTTMQHWNTGNKVIEVGFISQTFCFDPQMDIVSFIKPMMVPNEEAMNYFEDLKNQMTENFLSLKEEA